MAMKLGMNAVAYYHAAAGTSLASMSALLDGVRDVSLSISGAVANVSTRAGAGWEQARAALRTLEVSFKMPLDTADAGFLAIKTAYTTGARIAAAFLTDSKATTGAEGPVGDFSVVKFDRAEPVDGAQEVDVTLKLASYTAWCKVGVGNLLSFTTQPSASTAAGQAFSTQPVVTIKDAAGNTITTGADATATVTITLSQGLGALGGTASMAAVAGVANFSGKGLSVSVAGADKVLTATAELAMGTRTTTTTPVFTIT